MSKSKGNLVFVSQLRRDGVDPAAIRLTLLAHHYRSDWEYTTALLDEAQQRLARWRAAVSRPDGPPPGSVVEEIRVALADDLNSPAALAAVDRWAAEQEAGGGSDEGAPGVVSRAVDALLGVAL
jgi:L-cysteine:1D-myo-inositol 2-amino-2-deoxy-alpha-D-glucopyranoside ligase